MEIYLEYALFDNLLMNSIILILSTKLLKQHVKKIRIFFSVILGTIVAVLLPLFAMPSTVIIIIKLCLGISMVLIAFQNHSFKSFLLNFLVFISTTAVLGGLAFAIIFAFDGKISLSNGELVTSEFPISIIYLIILAYVYLLFSAIKFFYKKRRLSQFIFPVKFCVNNSQISAEAFLDSGNVLKDPISQKPVIIIGYKTFAKMFEDLPIEKVLLKKITEDEIHCSHYISYSTITGKENDMLIFPITKLVVDFGDDKKEISDAVGGLSFAKFQKNFNCDVLLHPDCF